MKKLIFLLMGIINYAHSATPVLNSTTPTCGNKYCMKIRGLDFDADASVQVWENGTLTRHPIIFSGNDIYSRTFSTNEDTIFFPIQNLSLQNKWNNNGLCFRVNNNGVVSNKICEIRTANPIQPDFMGETVESYSAGEDLEHTSYVVTGDATPLIGGNKLKIWGNSWKQIDSNYTVTANTVLKFSFRSNQQQSETNGIGFKLAGGSNKHFQVFGTESTWENQDYHNYFGTAFKSYEIPIGDYFTGDITKMYFTADEDIHVGQNIVYKNPRLEEVIPTTEPPLAFECDQSPLPLKIDCPNDEFFSLNEAYPGMVPDPESFSNEYQWAADYMNFAYGWYYTNGTSRIGIMDGYVTLNDENSVNLRPEFSGTFASKNKLEESDANKNLCIQIYPWTSNEEDFNWDTNQINQATPDEYGYGYSETYGYPNIKQTHMTDYPDIFINEYSPGFGSYSGTNIGKARLEIAIKSSIDTSNLTLTIDNGFDAEAVVFIENTDANYEELRALQFNINDFYPVVSTIYGYSLYVIDNQSTTLDINGNHKTLEINPQRYFTGDTTPGSGGGIGFALISGTSFYSVNNYRNIVKINGNHIQAIDSISDHKEVRSCIKYFSDFKPNPSGYDHGSYILSLFGSHSNNSVGMSSYCKDCSLSYFDFNQHNAPGDTNNEKNDNEENAYSFAIESGNQILSNSTSKAGFAICDEQISTGGVKLDLCAQVEQAIKRDIVIVASAGNHLQSFMNWPANETDSVIGVVGTDPFGGLWQRTICLFSPDTKECGTNFDADDSKFAAPAENILLHSEAGDYNPFIGCTDSNFGFNDDGYQRCSGTSFSAPIMASVVAMIRSINPLVSFDDIKQILWDARVQDLADQRYAIPRADKSVEITLGKSNSMQIVNRLTPMFRMKTNNVTTGPFAGNVSYLSTTIPQVAVASIFGTYLVKPSSHSGAIELSNLVKYSSDTYSEIVTGYNNFKYELATTQTARAPFFVFAGHRNPFNNEADDLLPLHHMARPEFYGGNCTKLADHAYSTTRANGFDVNNFCGTYNIHYLYEGIEGYILPTCPSGVDCYENTGNANDLQCLKLRYSANNNAFALMMASEVNESMFQSYGTDYKDNFDQTMAPITTLAGMSNAECLGYVFPNVDGDVDGIIDGMELILGTNPKNPDTDGDGKTDGIEYPLAGIPLSDPMVRD